MDVVVKYFQMFDQIHYFFEQLPEQLDGLARLVGWQVQVEGGHGLVDFGHNFGHDFGDDFRAVDKRVLQ